MDKQFWAMVTAQMIVLIGERHMGKTEFGSILGWIEAKLLQKKEK
jgi:hypothetical protein